MYATGSARHTAGREPDVQGVIPIIIVGLRMYALF
jgi:hypothetical protein